MKHCASFLLNHTVEDEIILELGPYFGQYFLDFLVGLTELPNTSRHANV